MEDYGKILIGTITQKALYQPKVENETMAIKQPLLLAFLLFSICSGVSQGLEQQRKYWIPTNISNTKVVHEINGLNGFSSYHHSDLTYFDLYMDTPELKLFELGYSLRFRKRLYNDSISTYSLQLKSEITSATDIRMEIDEPQLYFYRVKTDEEWVSIESVLDTLFSQYHSFKPPYKDSVIHNQLILIKKWVALKIEGAIAPFQELKHLNAEAFKAIQLSGLAPILCGRSIRSRGHIYIDEATKDSFLLNIPVNKIKLDKKPNFFIQNPKKNWILEFSVDSSEFYPIRYQSDAVRFREFEIENKYMNTLKGTALLERFEIGLLKTLSFELKSDSKYRQCMIKLNNLH